MGNCNFQPGFESEHLTGKLQIIPQSLIFYI